MAPEAAHAYDQVVLVGPEQSAKKASRSESGPATTPAKKIATKKTSPAKIPAKVGPAKKAVAKKTGDKKAGEANGQVSIQQILDAVPALKTGQPQALGDVAKLLHDEKLLGKNATSTKLFKKYPDQFELSPSKQPNKVRYLPAAK
jgi:hypothetical protein